MSKYTAEQVESAAEILEQDQNAPSWKRLSEMLNDYAALLRERESTKSYFPKVNSISRDGECSKALSIFFAIRPTDDEMRAVHDCLSCRESAKAVVTELPRYTEWRHLREKGVWSNGVPAWAKDHEGRMNDYRAAVAVIDELAEAVAPMLSGAHETPCSLAEALNVMENWAIQGNALSGDDVERFRAIAERIAPMLASARAPEGWQLVPVEPTVEMMRAGDDTGFHTYTGAWSITPDACWQAMLAAAPKPETKE